MPPPFPAILLAAVNGERGTGRFSRPPPPQVRERREGYESALRDAGLRIDPALTGHCAYTVDAGRALACDLMTRATPRPTALLAAGNLLTAGAYEALAELALSVPEDVALAGFGPAPRSALERQDLTMVGLPAEDMGYRTGRLLLNRVRENVPPATGAGAAGAVSDPVREWHPVHEQFPVELLLSRSCGCPSGAPNPTDVPSVLRVPAANTPRALARSACAKPPSTSVQ